MKSSHAKSHMKSNNNKTKGHVISGHHRVKSFKEIKAKQTVAYTRNYAHSLRGITFVEAAYLKRLDILLDYLIDIAHGKGWDVYDLGIEAGLSYITVVNTLERKTTYPRFSTIYKIATALRQEICLFDTASGKLSLSRTSKVSSRKKRTG